MIHGGVFFLFCLYEKSPKFVDIEGHQKKRSTYPCSSVFLFPKQSRDVKVSTVSVHRQSQQQLNLLLTAYNTENFSMYETRAFVSAPGFFHKITGLYVYGMSQEKGKLTSCRLHKPNLESISMENLIKVRIKLYHQQRISGHHTSKTQV